MKGICITMAAIGMLFASTLYAKRAAPEEVATIKSEKIEYRAPKEHMGCVEAWQGQDLLWRRQIYVVVFNPGLERDVQDVFIKTLQKDGNSLIITNERNSEYKLNLKTKVVDVQKGSLVESR